MTDLRDRMGIYDRAPAPDYWNEVELRASSRSVGTAAPARSAQRLLLLAAAMLLLALAVGGAALALSRLVDPPPESSVTHLVYGLDGDIYLADADGQNPVRIADGEPFGEDGECSSFAGEGSMWSPDGRYLAYRDGQMGCSSRSVNLSDADGHPVASFPGTGWLISWSPDSTRLATWLELFETVGIYGIDGGRQALLTAPPGCVGSGDHDPLWSPDGQSVVAGDCEMPIDGQTPRRVSGDDPRSRFQWVYSPDGTLVAYATYTEDGSGRTGSLVIADANGTELQVLTYPTDWDDPTGEVVFFDNIVWSPLGDRVAFTWRTLTIDALPHTSELRVLDISSGDETTIAAEAGIGGPFAYSPEGDRILYSRDVDGEMGFWSITADGSDAQLLVPGADWGDWQPLPAGSDPSATPVAFQSASASAEPAAAVALPSSGEIASGTYFLVNPYQDDDPVRDCATGCADYQRIIFTLPAGWARTAGLVHKHLGQPREVAFSVWTVDEVYFDPCHWESSAGEPLDGSAIHATSGNPHLGMDDEAALLNQVGRTAAVPTTVTFVQGETSPEGVGALRVELSVDSQLDLATCDRAEYRSWTEWDVPDGANSHHAPGQVDVVYLVDVDRRPFVIDASHMPAASDADLAELEAIITSMIVDR